MADISDVQQAFAEAAAAALYPTGPAGPSVANVPALVYPGWPMADHLDTDLRAGKVHVTVWARGDGHRSTRYLQSEEVIAAPVQTISASILYNVVTLAGTVAVPQVLHINGEAYVVQANDTLESIAQALAALVPGATADGFKVACPPSARPTFACGSPATIGHVLRQQTDSIQVTVWAHSPDARTAVAKVIDRAFAELDFIPLPDGFPCRLQWMGTVSKDKGENALLYRRDILFTVDYPTTKTSTAMQIATTTVGMDRLEL